MIDGFDTAGLLWSTAIGLGPVGFALWVGFRPLGTWIDRWAEARDVPLTEVTRPFVTARLTRARRMRTVGFIIGWVNPYVALWLTRSAYDSPGIGWLFIPGYLAGALIAELWAARTNRPSGAAAMASRDIGRYLPRGARRWIWYTATTSAVLGPLYILAPKRENWGLTTAESVMSTVAVLVLLAGAELLPRMVVRRRQAFHSGDLLRADDAMRSWSAHAVTGVLLASMLVIVGNQLWNFATVDIQPVRWVIPWLGFGCLVAALGSFQLLSSYTWRWRVPGGPSTQPSS